MQEGYTKINYIGRHPFDSFGRLIYNNNGEQQIIDSSENEIANSVDDAPNEFVSPLTTDRDLATKRYLSSLSPNVNDDDINNHELLGMMSSNSSVQGQQQSIGMSKRYSNFPPNYRSDCGNLASMNKKNVHSIKNQHVDIDSTGMMRLGKVMYQEIDKEYKLRMQQKFLWKRVVRAGMNRMILYQYLDIKIMKIRTMVACISDGQNAHVSMPISSLTAFACEHPPTVQNGTTFGMKVAAAGIFFEVKKMMSQQHWRQFGSILDKAKALFACSRGKPHGYVIMDSLPRPTFGNSVRYAFERVLYEEYVSLSYACEYYRTNDSISNVVIGQASNHMKYAMLYAIRAFLEPFYKYFAFWSIPSEFLSETMFSLWSKLVLFHNLNMAQERINRIISKQLSLDEGEQAMVKNSVAACYETLFEYLVDFFGWKPDTCIPNTSDELSGFLLNPILNGMFLKYPHMIERLKFRVRDLLKNASPEIVVIMNDSVVQDLCLQTIQSYIPHREDFEGGVVDDDILLMQAPMILADWVFTVKNCVATTTSAKVPYYWSNIVHHLGAAANPQHMVRRYFAALSCLKTPEERCQLIYAMNSSLFFHEAFNNNNAESSI